MAIDVQGNTVVVHSNLSAWGGYPGQQSGPVEISLGTHDLGSAWLSGSGSLAIDKIKGLSFDLSAQGSASATVGRVDVDQLNVSVVGTANASLAGQASKLTAVVRGISSLDAANLATKDATIGAEGSATVAAAVSNSATIDGSGPATVRLTADNEIFAFTVDGSPTDGERSWRGPDPAAAAPVHGSNPRAPDPCRG